MPWSSGVLYKKALKKFTKFTGIHLCWSLFWWLKPATLLKRDSSIQNTYSKLFGIFVCDGNEKLHMKVAASLSLPMIVSQRTGKNSQAV